MANSKVKLMCSYGGKIQPRLNNTTQLTYVGGDTKIFTVDRNVKFSDMILKLTSLCNIKSEFCVKYQFPGDDLDALVSVIDDDDVEYMMFEYDRLVKDSTRTARLRLFLFGVKKVSETEKVVGENSEFPVNPDFLFGFDKEYVTASKIVEEKSGPALDLLQIPGIIVPGFSGTDNNDDTRNNYGAQDGQGSGVEYMYRVPLYGGGGPEVYGMVNWEQPSSVYGILPGGDFVQDQKMMNMGENNQLSQKNA